MPQRALQHMTRSILTPLIRTRKKTTKKKKKIGGQEKLQYGDTE